MFRPNGTASGGTIGGTSPGAPLATGGAGVADVADRLVLSFTVLLSDPVPPVTEGAFSVAVAPAGSAVIATVPTSAALAVSELATRPPLTEAAFGTSTTAAFAGPAADTPFAIDEPDPTRPAAACGTAALSAFANPPPAFVTVAAGAATGAPAPPSGEEAATTTLLPAGAAADCPIEGAGEMLMSSANANLLPTPIRLQPARQPSPRPRTGRVCRAPSVLSANFAGLSLMLKTRFQRFSDPAALARFLLNWFAPPDAATRCTAAPMGAGLRCRNGLNAYFIGA